MMENKILFEKLLHAETEEDVEAILNKAGYLNDDSNIWRPLGFENNFAAIGNQQSDPTAALIEKIINSIDAVLMARCYGLKINPEGSQAPNTMTAAVEQFFKVKDGQIGNLTSREQQQLADNIHLIAVGGKTNPNYLIVDKGEGQTPAKFPDTFLSLLRSNKMRIPFVQGKFNSGGTGVLQFCGEKNFQLIVSRRNPDCPVEPNDKTASQWGFTIVRRLLPSGGRRSSMYVYLAPGGQVPSFQADEVKALPTKSTASKPGEAYSVGMHYGTCVKLYNYRWKAKSMVTVEGRYELERFLHLPCLPFRVDETRDYRANYYSATIIGGWNSAVSEDEEGESTKLEEGFPASGELILEKVGNLPYQIALYKEGTNKRHVAHGVYFVVNGQVHGSLPSDFISRRLKFDYLKDELLVTVDCTKMNEQVREDFFMASRDRVRRNEVYTAIEIRLTEELRDHPGLKMINQVRRQKEMEKHLNEESPLKAFQSLLDTDPTLSSLFASGDRLVTATGPSTGSGKEPPFVGRKFPTYFRLEKEPKGGLVKGCPINRTARVTFETDAVNDYFTRTLERGKLKLTHQT